jgi:DNA-binding response OmpR family regulator
MEAGYSIIECVTGAAAIRTVADDGTTLGLVLLTVGLPDAHGFDVCARIKVAQPTLPVVLTSAMYRTAHARRDGLNAGADAYLIEPIHETRLVQVVRALTTPAEAAPPPAACLRTTENGIILWASETAAALLNLKALPGRNLLTFFNGERGRVQTEMRRAAAGQVVDFKASLRPRDRKPLSVRLDLAAALDGEGSQLEWTIHG